MIPTLIFSLICALLEMPATGRGPSAPSSIRHAALLLGDQPLDPEDVGGRGVDAVLHQPVRIRVDALAVRAQLGPDLGELLGEVGPPPLEQLDACVGFEITEEGELETEPGVVGDGGEVVEGFGEHGFAERGDAVDVLAPADLALRVHPLDRSAELQAADRRVEAAVGYLPELT